MAGFYFPIPYLPPDPEQKPSRRERWLTTLFWAVMLAVCGVAIFFIYQIGHENGRLAEWKQERSECVKRETRLFARTGFLIFQGSGEVEPRDICVEWIIRR
jgi:hypothetical protein